MTITISTDSPTTIAASLNEGSEGVKPKYVIVYASTDEQGRSWCGDCREAEGLVNEVFGGEGRDVLVVYAGQRDEWRNPANPWRQKPFEIERLPTLVKVVDGKWERLVEGDVYDRVKLDGFVGK